MKIEEKIEKHLQEEFDGSEVFFDGEIKITFTIAPKNQDNPNKKDVEKVITSGILKIGKIMDKLYGVGDVDFYHNVKD